MFHDGLFFGLNCRSVVCSSLCHALCIIHDTFTSPLWWLILPPVLLLRQCFLNIAPLCLCACVTHTVGCTNVALWHWHREQDGYFGEEKPKQTFPALETELGFSKPC